MQFPTHSCKFPTEKITVLKKKVKERIALYGEIHDRATERSKSDILTLNSPKMGDFQSYFCICIFQRKFSDRLKFGEEELPLPPCRDAITINQSTRDAAVMQQLELLQSTIIS